MSKFVEGLTDADIQALIDRMQLVRAGVKTQAMETVAQEARDTEAGTSDEGKKKKREKPAK